MRRLSVLASVTPFLLAAAAAVTPGCAKDFDPSRVATEQTTLGEDMYSALCDRVGASSLAEDLTGASYHSICHKSGGKYGSKVDASFLPTVSEKRADARRLGIAKVEAMASHRTDLVQAFDTILPDTTIPDPLYPGKQVRLHDAANEFAKRLTPLMEQNPYGDEGGVNPYFMPEMTQTLATLLTTIASDDAAKSGLARLGARRGYRPIGVSLGALRPLLAYPDLRNLLKLAIDRLGNGGKLEPLLQKLMAVIEQEMATLQPDAPVPPLTVDDARTQPNRPRQTLEVMAKMMLFQDPQLGAGSTAKRFIVQRDLRGYAIPAGMTTGSVPAPFVDADHDGLPDVDLLGRFVDGLGNPVDVPTPFLVPGLDAGDQVDADTGRVTVNGQFIYSYLDTSNTLVGRAMRDLDPLVTPQGTTDAPLPSTLMKTLEGAYVLYGQTATRTAAYGTGGSAAKIDYPAFDPSTSPLLDLTYAVGQVLGAPESDDYLGSILKLQQEHPEKTGRAMALALAIRAESQKPDYANAVLADDSTFWDELTHWMAKAARIDASQSISGKGQGLLSDLLVAFTDPNTQQYLGKAFADSFKYKDRLSYNPDDINGPAYDKDTKHPLDQNTQISIPVDHSQGAVTGNDASVFQRLAHVINLSRGVRACNKQGAQVPATVDVPSGPLGVCQGILGDQLQLGFPCSKIGVLPQICLNNGEDIEECALFQIDDLGVFFLDSTLPYDHPRRSQLVIHNDQLNQILGDIATATDQLCGQKVGLDDILTASSGIQGMGDKPTPEALARLVFFGADNSSFPSDDLDPYVTGKNATTNGFIAGTMIAAGTQLCPSKDGYGVPQCKSFDQTLRGIGMDTFLYAEQPYLATHPAGCVGQDCSGPSSGFYAGLGAMVQAFADYRYKPENHDFCKPGDDGLCDGENMFLDFLAILDKHWPAATSALQSYEPLLAWIFTQSDMFGTAADLAQALHDQQYVSQRTGMTRSGLGVATSMTRYLLDPQIAAQVGLTDMSGDPTSAWNDGTIQPQVTPYELFVRALKKFDQQFDEAGADKKARWRAARSELVDQFLTATQTGGWTNPLMENGAVNLGMAIREQTNARCPDRETSGKCDWARSQLHVKLGTVMQNPLFSTMNELLEALRADDEARIAVENLLVYLLQQAKDPDALSATLATGADLLQALHDDQDLAPLLNALAPAAHPGATFDEQGNRTEAERPGVAHLTLEFMKVLLDDHPEITDPDQRARKVIDRYHLLDQVLVNIVTAPAAGKKTPLEVIVDTVADIDRIDASQTDTLAPEDYDATFRSVGDFLTNDYRGLEQFYTIVRNRDAN